MIENTTTTNDKDLDMTTGGTEPATAHDTKEGGILGAVGGAVVGMLAGGPVGAVIGAVAGGVASAAAVSVVDKHDHDYNRTVAADKKGSDPDTTGYSPAAYSPGAVPAANTAYGTNLAQNTGGETVIPIVEEELEVGKRQVQSGGARIVTSVTERPVEEQVTLHEEHLTVDRRPVNRAVSGSESAFQAQDIEMTEMNEVPVVSKEARVVEEVVVGKTATDRTETVRDTVRRTNVDVEDLTVDHNRR